MNFQINVDSLKTALKIAQKAMDKNEDLPVRTYFHVSLTDDGHVVILASGQLFSVTLKLTPDCVITHGEPILLSTKAIKYLDKLDVEEVVVVRSETQGISNSVEIVSNSGYVAYNSFPADQYPLPKQIDETLTNISYPVSMRSIAKVIDFVGCDVLKPVIETIQVKASGRTTKVSASDGFTIARMEEHFDFDIPIEKELSILLPKRIAQFMIEENLSMNVFESENNVVFETIGKSLRLQFRKVNTAYLNVDGFLASQKTSFKAVVSNQALTNSILRLQTLGEKKFKITIRENDIVLTAQDDMHNIITEVISRTEEDDRAGWTEDVNIKLSLAVFEKALKRIHEGDIAINYTDGKSAVVIKGNNNPSQFYLTTTFSV